MSDSNDTALGYLQVLQEEADDIIALVPNSTNASGTWQPCWDVVRIPFFNCEYEHTVIARGATLLAAVCEATKRLGISKLDAVEGAG